jgi:hypothetical protein
MKKAATYPAGNSLQDAANSLLVSINSLFGAIKFPVQISSQPVCMEKNGRITSLWGRMSLGMHDFVAGREERAELFGSDFQAEPALGHLHGDCTQKISFADVHAAMAQDRIGGCEMEIEVRQHEMV